MERKPTSYHHLIYFPEWHTWKDPDIPEWFNPVDILIGSHARDNSSRTAIIANGQPVSYLTLMNGIRRNGSALKAVGIDVGEKVLLFGTDLEYIEMWLACIHIGAIPAVVMDEDRSPRSKVK
jgi:non-ribosomal peptide synthetase component E (peptide arylation enzyme)